MRLTPLQRWLNNSFCMTALVQQLRNCGRTFTLQRNLCIVRYVSCYLARTSPRLMHQQPWPRFNESHMQLKTIDVVLQVQGKKVGLVTVDASAVQDPETLLRAIEGSSEVESVRGSYNVVKTIAVTKSKNPIVNFVIAK